MYIYVFACVHVKHNACNRVTPQVVGREMLLHLIDHLVTSYGTNETLTQFLNTVTVHVLPSINPDGYSNSSVEDCMGDIGR